MSAAVLRLKMTNRNPVQLRVMARIVPIGDTHPNF